MPAQPQRRAIRPLTSRYAVLLGTLLAALLFAAPSCSFPPHAQAANGSPTAGAVLQPGPTGAEGHPHPDPAHGFTCSPADPAPSLRFDTPVDSGTARPHGAPAPATAVVPAPCPGDGRPARARSARSTLAVVCRWRL
ncbi:hypothetical protein [Streptomyces sp. NPDC058157]|uniref:hypothetical protein n=1 Tax=Streptomyces sp. NPDC058157 TaxID=3346360 RepID=UPI0036E40C7F